MVLIIIPTLNLCCKSSKNVKLISSYHLFKYLFAQIAHIITISACTVAPTSTFKKMDPFLEERKNTM